MIRWLLVIACGCGRIGFEARTGDAGSDSTTLDTSDVAIAPWSHLVAYANQTCAALAGELYCWGDNSSGQLGLPAPATVITPTKVPLPAGTLVDFALGQTHGCAIVDGTIYCYGTDVGTATPTARPIAVQATAISAGRDFTCAIAMGIWCWGLNNVGQLGVGDTTTRPAPTALAVSPGFTQIRCGDDHACAYSTSGGGTKCWGHNDNGTLGDNMSQAMQPSATSPVDVLGVNALPLIAGWHACALDGSTVSCWGRDAEGELGNGGTFDSYTPIPIVTNATLLATGGGPTDYDATCAVQGHAQCWGRGTYGRLGQGVAADSNVPVDVVGLPANPTEIAIGYDHACAIVGTDIYCWGRGNSGQLGDGLMADSLSPVKVIRPF